MDLSIIDGVILCTILLTGLCGLWFGAIRLIVPFSLILVVTTILYNYPQISVHFKNESLVNVFLYLLIGFAAIIVFAVATRLTRGIVRTAGVRWADHFLGLTLGLVLGGLIVGMAIWGAQTYNLNLKWKDLLQESKLAEDAIIFFKFIMSWSQKFIPRLERENVPWWNRTLW